MVEPSDPRDPARALPAGVADQLRHAMASTPACHRVAMDRAQRRRALPGRARPPGAVTIARSDTGAWLDVSGPNGGAGVAFNAEQWSQLCLEALILLFDLWEDEQ